MTRKTKEPPAELDDKALDAAHGGSEGGYVLTQVEHAASAQAAEVRHRSFFLVDRTRAIG